MASTAASSGCVGVILALLLLNMLAGLSHCQSKENIVITPGLTQFIPEGFQGNVTFFCSVSMPSNNSAVWVINNLQIVPERISELEPFGIFIFYDGTRATLSVDTTVRSDFASIGLQCAESVPGPTPSVAFSDPLTIVTYGRPGIPDPAARVRSSDPTVIEWGIPPNLTSAAPVSYSVTASSVSLNISRSFSVNRTELSLEELERQVVNITGAGNLCHEFNFTVVASLEGVLDSDPAISTDIIPNSIDVGPVNDSLRIFSVAFSSSDVVAGFSFQAAGTCSRSLPITEYFVMVDGQRSMSFEAPVGVAVINQEVRLPVDQNRRFSVAIEACSTAVCRTSSSTVLNSTDVQTAEVIFFENNIFLTCRFANGSSSQGCVFVFEANLNSTGAPTEEFRVARSGHLGNQCNASANQQNGYMSFSVYDLEQNGQMGSVRIAVVDRVLDSEQEYLDLTRCVIMRDVVRDLTAVAIAVPVIIIVFLIVLVPGGIVLGFWIYRQRRNYQREKRRKPRLAQADDEGEDLELIIDSNNADIVKEPMPDRIKPYDSLAPSTPLQTDSSSLRARPPPVEVELDHDHIRLRVNKTALKAVARFHMLVKKQQSESSMAANGSLDKVSMMALSGHAPSRVKFSKKLCDACDTPNVVREVEIDEEGLRSWANFQYVHQPDTPPESTPTSPIAWGEEKMP